MEEHQTSIAAISKSRLEMLVDGVFAIAMTLLVLELKIPELADRHSIQELARAIAHQAPTFGSYLLSFLVLGMFWYRHNQHYRHFRVISRGMLALHFVQLAAAASFPFSAALFGRYPTNILTVVVYLACILVYAYSSFATLIVARRSGSMSAELTDAAYRRSRRRAISTCLTISALFAVNLLRMVTTASVQTTTSAERSADDKAIRDLAARWQAALLARDADVQASMFADDGVSYHDGQEPLVGPSSIRAWESRSKASHPKAIITATTDRIQIAAAGDMAVQTGEGKLTSLGGNGEDQAVHRQRFVTVWKKVGGEWKVAHDIAVNITPW
jgi:uncharacterized protein (TIGR02246 family)